MTLLFSAMVRLPLKKRQRLLRYIDLDKKEKDAIGGLLLLNSVDPKIDTDILLQPPPPKKLCCREYEHNKLKLPCLESILEKFKKDELRQEKCVIEKYLNYTDVEKQYACLAIPISEVVDMEFLNDSEIEKLENKGKIEVRVRGCFSVEGVKMKLSKWDYRGKGFKYALIGGWNQFRIWNGLQKGDFIRVVSVRFKDDSICLAIHGGNQVTSLLPNWGVTRPRTSIGRNRKFSS